LFLRQQAQHIRNFMISLADDSQVSGSFEMVLASQAQKKVNEAQLKLYTVFEKAGAETYTEWEVFQRYPADLHFESWEERREIFMQLIIYLWLISIKPPGVSFQPPLQLAKVWETFIIFTTAYRDFCNFVVDEYIDYNPIVKMIPEASDPLWFGSVKDIQRFLGNKVKLIPKYWKP
jgi:hypothetical protein